MALFSDDDSFGGVCAMFCSMFWANVSEKATVFFSQLDNSYGNIFVKGKKKLP